MERLPTVKQMQHLCALARERHFSKAAARVGVTQSTLSASIKELEDTLGGAVVDRSGRRVTLTPLGEMALEPIEQILARLTELTVVAREQAEPLGGALRLGVIPTISPFLLPRLLPALRRRYPRLKLYLREDQTAHLLEQLERGDLDVLLLALPYACEGEKVVLVRDELAVALRRDHPLAARDNLSPADLRAAGDVFLTLQDGHCLRDQALLACGWHHNRQDGYAATSLHTLVQMVDNGLGIALLPRLAVKAGILSGTHLVTVPLTGAHAFRDLALLWRKGSARAEEMRLLAGQFKQLLQ